jgi:hypothetical protein
MMMKRAIIVFMLLMSTIFVSISCGEKYSIFSEKYPVNFGFDTSIAPYNQVFGMGVFITARISGNYLVVTSSDGTEYKFPLTEVDARTFRMGLGGLIIGTPSLNNDEISIWAYDLACPICDLAKYRLSVEYSGIARCSHCATRFDLNNSGFVISSSAKDARPLYRYPVFLGGKIVSVRN